ncbi:MAG TPA: lipocalin-like domain-containing protein [Candidatus Acidoferrum sp.]|nr:lipocalin-like domain-containing protein [Candidatus Acidoferrum sp.]
MHSAWTRKALFGLFLPLSCAIVLAMAVAHARSAITEAASLASVRAQLVGSWRLVSRETHKANGELLADPNLAAVPMGFLVYDATGHVAAQLSRRGRTVEMLGDDCKIAVVTKSTPNTAQTILGYDAYFGTVTVHEKEGYVTHHLESALFPGDIGRDVNRNFKLAGDRLTLSFDTTTQDGLPITRSLVWERIQ